MKDCSMETSGDLLLRLRDDIEGDFEYPLPIIAVVGSILREIPKVSHNPLRLVLGCLACEESPWSTILDDPFLIDCRNILFIQEDLRRVVVVAASKASVGGKLFDFMSLKEETDFIREYAPLLVDLSPKLCLLELTEGLREEEREICADKVSDGTLGRSSSSACSRICDNA
jgi:hypothetical protein